MRNTNLDIAWLAMNVAAAGSHHVLLVGAPTTPKFLLANHMAMLLPEPTGPSAARIAAIRGSHRDRYYPLTPSIDVPWSAPHRSSTMDELIGSTTRPGAASLAHKGVLLLEDAPEWRAGVLRSLLQAMEQGSILRRSEAIDITHPADFQLVLTAGECPCGPKYPDAHLYACSEDHRSTYLHRIPPELTHYVEVRLSLNFPKERPSLPDNYDECRAAVATARAAAADRWKSAGYRFRLNRDIPDDVLNDSKWKPHYTASDLLDYLLATEAISHRGYNRLLRLAWSLADLEGHTTPSRDDILRVIGFQMLGLSGDEYA